MAHLRKITTLPEFEEELRKQTSLVKKNLLIVTPKDLPPVLEILAQRAYASKRIQFVYIAHYNLNLLSDIIRKMKTLGNIQFRQLEGPGTFWGCNRDDIEVIYGHGDENTLELTVSEDPADVERIKVKMTGELLPGSKKL